MEPNCYKLTDSKDGKYFTRNSTIWGENKGHRAPGTGEICSSGWIHCYDTPLTAALFFPAHVRFARPVLWAARWAGDTINDNGVKRGVQNLRTLYRVPFPRLTILQRLHIAARVIMKAYPFWTYQDMLRRYMQKDFALSLKEVDEDISIIRAEQKKYLPKGEVAPAEAIDFFLWAVDKYVVSHPIPWYPVNKATKGAIEDIAVCLTSALSRPHNARVTIGDILTIAEDVLKKNEYKSQGQQKRTQGKRPAV